MKIKKRGNIFFGSFFLILNSLVVVIISVGVCYPLLGFSKEISSRPEEMIVTFSAAATFLVLLVFYFIWLQARPMLLAAGMACSCSFVVLPCMIMLFLFSLFWLLVVSAIFTQRRRILGH